MVIRPYVPADKPALLELHERHSAGRLAKGEGFWFADPDDPIHFVTLVAEEDGKVVAAMTGRACCEAFLTIDPDWNGPRERFGLIQDLLEKGGAEAFRAGFREAHIGTRIRGYARRLSRLTHIYVDNRFRLMLNLFGKYNGKEVA